MAKQPTIPVNVVDKSIPADDHSLIAIINEPNPVTGYEINEEQLRQLIQLPQYWITDENGRTISGVNFYEYFPRGGGGRLPIVVEKTITENGVYMAVDDHADGYSKVTVNTPVPPPAPVLIEKTVTENGTYLPSDDDADGYSKVTVDTYVPTYKTKTITENGTYTASSDNADGYSSVVVKTLDRGKPVKFVDYDGTILAAYTKEEFLSLTSFPPSPNRPEIGSSSWNWQFNKAVEYVNNHGSLIIGAVYNFFETKIFITLTAERKSPMLQLYLDSQSTYYVNWGDGGYIDTLSSSNAGFYSKRHNYSNPGDYVIKISRNRGRFDLKSSITYMSTLLWDGNESSSSANIAYANAIQKILIGPDVREIGDYAFYNCYSLKEVIMTSASVTKIGNNAFNFTSLSAIVIPNGVTSIGMNAFYFCASLTVASLSYSVNNIADYVFYWCKSLLSINIPDSITEIGAYAFYFCQALTDVTLPSNLTKIGDNAFNYTPLKSLIIPNTNNITIDRYAFNYCNALQTITFGSHVTSIGDYAMCHLYPLRTLVIPDSVTSIGSNAFQNCFSLTSLTIGSGVISIGSYAFQNCQSLITTTVPDSVTSIGTSVFQSCYSLTSLTIGSHVTSIGSSAFQGCYSLQSIRFRSITPPSIANSNVWTNVPTTCIIYVPNSSLNTYKYATNYPNPNTYTYIGY